LNDLPALAFGPQQLLQSIEVEADDLGAGLALNPENDGALIIVPTRL
jgi:hypothetical protein